MLLKIKLFFRSSLNTSFLTLQTSAGFLGSDSGSSMSSRYREREREIDR